MTALTRLGTGRARIAVAALNPHAGEGGLFGRHDIDVAAPVIAEAVAARAATWSGRCRATPSS